ncbi:hypothetical protein [Leptolyngbya sp. ST-U4]|uniref:hypothetical protein n=1 Tax=Leptolyngbya sp. ST-U4 TaxID=2933912 RepID=UPI003299A79B
MVASPEVCRRNGAKSKGAVTARGKAIASRNATKHGLLAKQPPLLITEDLATFESLVQGLIDHYQPQNPTEHFLIQQVAMGMVKQHRLWSVEVAIANLEILKAQQEAQFPDLVVPPRVKVESDLLEKRIPPQQVLTKEREILKRLISLLDEDMRLLKTDPHFQMWFEGVQESVGSAYYPHDRTAPVYQAQDELDLWLDQWTFEHKEQPYSEPLPSAEEVVTRITQVQQLARERIQAIEQLSAEHKALEARLSQTKVASKGMQQQELFSRYQRSINRELYEALDRLEAIQQRKNEGSMGSFGQNPDLSTSTASSPRTPASFPTSDSCVS